MQEKQAFPVEKIYPSIPLGQTALKNQGVFA